MAEKLGILDLDHFVIDRREIDGRAGDPRRPDVRPGAAGRRLLDGGAGADGELRFFSPDATLRRPSS